MISVQRSWSRRRDARAGLASLPSRAALVVLDALLATGILLSTASQLRVGGSPVGPGEACLAIWVVASLAREADRLGPPLTKPLASLLIFWALFAASQAIGEIVGLAHERIRDPVSARHDVAAYLLIAAVSCLSVIEPGASERLRRVAWVLVASGALCLIVQLADAWNVIHVPILDPWYWDRFRGWSENPNQLALLAAALTLLSLHLAQTAGGVLARMAALCCGTVPLTVGVLTKSDSFTLFLIVATAALLLPWTVTLLRMLDQRPTWLSVAVSIAILTLPISLLAIAPFVTSIARQSQDFATSVYEDSNQGEARVELWSEALAIGTKAGMLGFGPGPHLTDKRGEEAPPPNFESHNTVLDLLTQGGMLAVCIFIGLLWSALATAWRAGFVVPPALLIGLVIAFAMFHIVTRHPIFWFAVALCLVGEGPRRAAGDHTAIASLGGGH
jgi:hypothetical protein